MLSENQTQPGHYLGTFVALVLPGLGRETLFPGQLPPPRISWSAVQPPRFHPSHMRFLPTRNPAPRNVGIWMLSYSTSSGSWSRSSGSTREEQELARRPRDSADLPFSCPAHRRLLPSGEQVSLEAEKKPSESERQQRDSSLHKPCFPL